MEEVWLPVKGYIGLYWISNTGKVKNKHGRILKTFLARGYEKIELHKNDIPQKYLVHRLVAQAFIPNPLNLPCINHWDENKLNNRVENLFWCDHETNNNHGTRGKRIAEKVDKPVNVYENGELIGWFRSATLAATVLNVSLSGISQVANGKYGYKTVKGYAFIWAEK